MLEKATRVLTDEDKAMMDQAIEGRNGELRKIEVNRLTRSGDDMTLFAVHSGPPKAQEGLPI